MLAKRIIPCLDVDDGRVVKGVKFKEIRDAGDPVELAKFYDDQGADELTFLDIGASYKSRDIMIRVVEDVSKQVFIPFTVGGGIRSVEDMRKVLNAGADKVSLCTAAIKNPELLREGARALGSQCIVLSLDAKRVGDTWRAFTHGGRNRTEKEAVAWAKEAVELGAGEILLNSIDMDGTKTGYDLELTRLVARSVSVPVIASGGAGNKEQIADAFIRGEADAALLASLLHFGELTIKEIKTLLKEKGVPVR